MKISILFILFTVVSFNLAFSQNTYLPLVESGKNWNVMDELNFGSKHTSTYLIDGTTEIDSIIYHNLYVTYEEFPVSWDHYGYIRENTDKKIYFSLYDDNNPFLVDEKLIYDFDVEVNDLIYLFNLQQGWWSEELEFTVVDIDSIEVQQEFRRRIKYERTWVGWAENPYWVEGIGSLEGLLTSGYLGIDNDYVLLCTKQDESLVYQNENYGTCYLNTVSYLEYEDQAFDVFPVPTNNPVYFKSLGEGNSNIQIDIFSSLGEIVISVSFSSAQQFKIGMKGQPEGIYFYTIRNDYSILQQGKLIKK